VLHPLGFAAAEKDWDLAILDEAHGYTLQVDAKGVIKKRSERYKVAEKVADKAHRLILLTATPHSGKNESLWSLLRLLDPDAYGDRCPKKLELNSIQYRKVSKEQMKDMSGEDLFKPRHPHTVGYELEIVAEDSTGISRSTLDMVVLEGLRQLGVEHEAR